MGPSLESRIVQRTSNDKGGMLTDKGKTQDAQSDKDCVASNPKIFLKKLNIVVFIVNSVNVNAIFIIVSNDNSINLCLPIVPGGRLLQGMKLNQLRVSRFCISLVI